MERLTQEAEFGFEDWEQVLYDVPSDAEGAYHILDLAEAYVVDRNEDCAHILQELSLKMKAYEETGLTPGEAAIAKVLAVQFVKQTIDENISFIELACFGCRHRSDCESDWESGYGFCDDMMKNAIVFAEKAGISNSTAKSLKNRG